MKGAKNQLLTVNLLTFSVFGTFLFYSVLFTYCDFDALFLHIWVGSQDGLCQALCLVAECIQVIALLAVAENDTHAATYVSLWLSEDADAGMILLQCIKHVVV